MNLTGGAQVTPVRTFFDEQTDLTKMMKGNAPGLVEQRDRSTREYQTVMQDVAKTRGLLTEAESKMRTSLDVATGRLNPDFQKALQTGNLPINAREMVTALQNLQRIQTASPTELPGLRQQLERTAEHFSSVLMTANDQARRMQVPQIDMETGKIDYETRAMNQPRARLYEVRPSIAGQRRVLSVPRHPHRIDQCGDVWRRG